MIKFEVCAADPEVGKLYRLIIDGKTVREDLPLDEVIRAINARDEESLGEDHAPRRRIATAPAGPRNDAEEGRRTASPGESPSRCSAAPFGIPQPMLGSPLWARGRKGRNGNE